MRDRVFRFLLIIVGLSVAARSGSACSVCRCDEGMMLCSAGTSNQNSQLLSGLPDKGRFRFQLQNLVLSKSNALTEDVAPMVAAKIASTGPATSGTEHEREFRPSVRVAYGISSSLTAYVELPFSFKRLEERAIDGTVANTSSGLADAQASLAWSGPLYRAAGHIWAIGFAATLKLPTGKNDLSDAGTRLDEHLQPGTGSYDWQLGSSVTRMTERSSVHASLYLRLTGTNSFEYHYGRAVTYNLGAQRRLGSWLFGTLQVDGRYATRDTDHGAAVVNTGGSVVYLTPGLRMRLAQATSLVIGLQLPVWEDLYGVQSEKAILSTGVSLEL